MGREGHCKQITLACARSVSATRGFPCSRCVCFPCLHCSGSRLLCWELSDAGPWLHALPRSKPLRFRFSGTPQRRRLSWACVLCFSQVRAAQVTWCLATAHSPRGAASLITSLVPAAQLPGCAAGEPSQVCHVSPLGSSSLPATLLVDVNHPGSQENLVSNWEPAHSLVEDAISGAEIAPHILGLAVAHLPPCLQQGRDWSAVG